MLTLFTRAIYEDEVELADEGFLHPGSSPTTSTPSWRATTSSGVLARSRRPSAGGASPSSSLPVASGSSSWSSWRPRVSRPMTFVPYDRPVRAAFVGLGRIDDLNVRGYVDNPDVEVVALSTPARSDGPSATQTRPGPHVRAVAELAASGLEVDAVEALRPIPLHVEGVIELLDHGRHVNLQKPMCKTAQAQRMIDAATAADRVLRVMENYLFYEPLRRLKTTVESGELGPVSGYHLKMVGSGRGGACRPAASSGSSARCARRHPRVRRRVAQALDCAVAVRTDPRGAGLDRQHRGRPRRRHRCALDALVGARQRHPWAWHDPRHRPLPAVRLLHERRALGGDRPQGVRPREVRRHRPWHPAAEPRGGPPTARCTASTPSTTTGAAASGTRPELAAVAAHR